MWWFYLFWLPKYLQETFGLSLYQAILPLLVLYNITTVGSIGGGWLSSKLIDNGWTVNRARKTTMLICALGVVPVIYAPYCKNLWVVVALVGTALAAHQGWSANLFTTTSDMFPRSAVGSVVGIGGTMGAAGQRAAADRDRLHRRTDAQLPAAVHFRRLRLPDRAGDFPEPLTEARTRAAGLTEWIAPASSNGSRR